MNKELTCTIEYVTIFKEVAKDEELVLYKPAAPTAQKEKRVAPTLESKGAKKQK